MPTKSPRIALAALACLVASPALAQPSPAASACAEVSDRNLPPALAAWASPAEALAASASPDAPPVLLTAGKPAEMSLRPQADVRFQVKPGGGKPVQAPHAGLVTIRVPSAGVWRLSASAPVWIDVVGPHGLVESVGHGHLAPCTSLRKSVAFQLGQGEYLVQLSASPGAAIRLLLSPAPAE
jgi:hypothetical protein